jgi:hypothetical protein
MGVEEAMDLSQDRLRNETTLKINGDYLPAKY